MFYGFIKKCRFPDGRRDFYAHVVLADGVKDAKEKVQQSFAERNVWGLDRKKGIPLAVLEEIIEFSPSDSGSELYDKLCRKAFNLSQKEPQVVVVQPQGLPQIVPKLVQERKEDSCLFG
jgi:hypothetical protein